jgi:zinc transport system permease protein
MSAFLDAMQYDFMQHALVASMLAALLCAIVGTFIVIMRMVFLSGGVSHSAFAGLGAAHYFSINPFLGALLAAVLVSLVLARLIVHHKQPPDALIGLLWAAGMSIGVLFVYLTPGYTPDLMPYLFGNILTISQPQLVWMALFTMIVLLVTGLLFQPLVAVSFDDEFASLRGLPVGVLISVLMVLSSITIVLLIQTVGIILVMALMTIPPLIGLTLSKALRGVMLWAFASGLLVMTGGLLLAFQLDLPAGPIIVMFGIVLLGSVKLLKRFTSRT